MKWPTSKPSLICDTSVLLYMGRIEALDLLRHMFDPVYVPTWVAVELDAGRALRPDTVDPRSISWISIMPVQNEVVEALPPNRLGMGEKATIAYAWRHGIQVVGLDDREARTFAQRLGLHVIGTVGILVEAKRLGLIAEIRPILKALQKQGFYLSKELAKKALEMSGEATE